MAFHHEEVLQEMVKGDQSALDFLRVVYDIAHAWDDLVDRDKPVQASAINQAFFSALVVLPSNAFYRQNQQHLMPVLTNAMTNWQVANRLERGDDVNELKIAFILRSSYCDLVTQAALIVGGLEHAVAVGVEIRRFIHGEGFTGYLANLQTEKKAAAAAGEK